MANSEVVYVPVPGNSNCIYPIYVPVVMREPEVFKSSGRLSAGDYEETKNNFLICNYKFDIYHTMSCSEYENEG